MWFKKKGATRCHIQPGITCNGDCKNCDTWKEHQALYKAEGKEVLQLQTVKFDKQEPMGYNTPVPECWLKMDRED